MRSAMIARLALIPVLAASLAAAPAAAESECFKPNEARRVAGAHHLVSVQSAVRTALGRTEGELIAANLCRRDGRFLYVLHILAPDGRVIRAKVDAEPALVQKVP